VLRADVKTAKRDWNEDFQIRLTLQEADIERLQDSALLADLATGPMQTQHLQSLYFDTPDLRLEKKGVALRVRKEGARRIQTIKRPYPASKKQDQCLHAHERQEYESEIAFDMPVLDAIPDADIRKLVENTDQTGPLMPLFESRFERNCFPLRLCESTIILHLDHGELRTGCVQEKICELELELQDGEPLRLFELALALGRDFSLRYARKSKSHRGYALSRGASLTPPQYALAAPITLHKKMRIGDALSHVLRAGIDHLLKNEACALDGREPEGIHQMRVALRRLRTAVTLFEKAFSPVMREYLKEELGWLQRMMGPARDYDVFLEETIAPLVKRRPMDGSLELLKDGAEKERQAGYDLARSAILQPRYTALLLHVEAWLEREQARQRERKERQKLTNAYKRQMKVWKDDDVVVSTDAFGAPVARYTDMRPVLASPKRPIPRTARHILPADTPLVHLPEVYSEEPTLLDEIVGPMAEDILERRYKKMSKRGRQLMQESALEELHTLRIDGKKLRYSLEFFSAMYPEKKAKPFLRTLKGLQESLGSVNDAVIAEDLARQLCDKILHREQDAEGKDTLALPQATENMPSESDHEQDMMSSEPSSLLAHIGRDSGGPIMRQAAKAEGVIAGWHAACIETHLSEAAGLWKKFDSVKPFWQ